MWWVARACVERVVSLNGTTRRQSRAGARRAQTLGRACVGAALGAVCAWLAGCALIPGTVGPAVAAPATVTQAGVGAGNVIVGNPTGSVSGPLSGPAGGGGLLTPAGASGVTGWVTWQVVVAGGLSAAVVAVAWVWVSKRNGRAKSASA